MDNEELLNESRKLTETLKEKTFAYFTKHDIKLPIEVSNALEDVFDENDFTSDDEDVINIYFKEDLDDFLHAVTPYVQLNVQVSGGNSAGDVVKKYSYYNTVNVERSYFEEICLYDKETLISTVSKKDVEGLTTMDDPNDFGIFVLEEEEFHYGDYIVVPRLYIYVPLEEPQN